MPAIVEDIRYALRQFRKAPGFTATAILTLALGIGATTAIFSLVHAVLLKSLPVTQPSELLRIGDVENCCQNGGLEDDWSLFSYDQYRDFRDHTPGFSQLAAFQSSSDMAAVRRPGSGHPAESLTSEFVSGNALSTLGIAAYAGRLISPDDDRKGAAPVAMMSFRTWQQKYGEDRAILGSTFLIDGQPFTIIGITPPGFFGERLTSNPPSLWVPLGDEPLLRNSSSILDRPNIEWLNLIGRISPGANAKQIEAKMQLELRQWLLSPVSELSSEDRPLVPKQTLHLSAGGGGVQQMADNYKSGLHLLMWISSFVLLIACANMANLMLVRSTVRKQQISVRSALGAPRSRLVRQALLESITLSVLGGVAGVALAYGGTKLILHLAFPDTYIPIDASPSLAVLGFAFGVSLLTGVIFGVAPAWMSSHANPIEALRGANRATGQQGNLTQRVLVIVQASVSLVLLCAAGLLTQSLRNMQNQNFGFDAKDRYMLFCGPQLAGYRSDQLEPFYRKLHDALMSIPGVTSVSASLNSPLDGNQSNFSVYIEGQAPPPQGSNQSVSGLDRVSADYFKTIGTKILQGRGITEQDTASSRKVAVVNRTFANRFFKGKSAIGQHFGVMDQKYAGTYEIVGVTEDTQYLGPFQPIRPMYFVAGTQHVQYVEPIAQTWEKMLSYMNAIEIRTNGHVPNLESQVRRAVAQVNPNLPVISFKTLAEQVTSAFDQQSMIATLTSLFGVLALLLASIGLYGVTAYSVERRTNEIGLRMALGADRTAVLRMVIWGAFQQIFIGLAIGVPAAVGAGYAISSQLFGAKPYDPVILLLTTLTLCIAAFFAGVIPARRAASVEPMQALRME